MSFPAALVVDATSVYWANYIGSTPSGAGSIVKVPIAGGSTLTLASGLTYPDDIAVDESNVYFITKGVTSPSQTGAVMRVPLAGGASTTLWSAPLDPLDAGVTLRPEGIAVDANNVYWTTTEANGPTGAVMKMPK